MVGRRRWNFSTRSVHGCEGMVGGGGGDRCRGATGGGGPTGTRGCVCEHGTGGCGLRAARRARTGAYVAGEGMWGSRGCGGESGKRSTDALASQARNAAAAESSAFGGRRGCTTGSRCAEPPPAKPDGPGRWPGARMREDRGSRLGSRTIRSASSGPAGRGHRAGTRPSRGWRRNGSGRAGRLDDRIG